jgi:hypothetical protein
MSAISQFFPSGGGGGGNETPTGVKIPQDGVPVQILGVSGAGGAGGSSYCDGCGGRGAIFHATNYFVQSGCTVPITIGAGGAISGCPNGQGTQGGTTSFNYDLKPISVDGGGGGSKSSPCLCNGNGACPGGSGGGARFNPNCTGAQCIMAGEGKYFQKLNQVESCYNICWCPPSSYAFTSDKSFKSSEAEMLQYPWGVKGGFPGMPACKIPNLLPPALGRGCTCTQGDAGYSGGNSYCWGNLVMQTSCPGCPNPAYDTPKSSICHYYRSEIEGSLIEYSSPSPTTGTAFGRALEAAAGCSGGMIVQWATGFGGAPPTGFPGATDISPQTPGYYTYRFASSGSITLP